MLPPIPCPDPQPPTPTESNPWQREHEEALAAELEEARRQEQKLQQELEAEEEARLGLDEQYNSLQEEVEGKTRKLKKLWGKFKTAQVCVPHHCDAFGPQMPPSSGPSGGEAAVGEIPRAPCQHTSSKLRVTRGCGP